VATATVDGIETHYEVMGSGPPLLLFSPGGFNAVATNWWELGVYARIKPLDRLAQHYTCIVFDRREAGRSSGRLERITWSAYVAQAVGLLDHLEIDRANLMGGCIGCSQAAALAVRHPQRVQSMVLYSPAGGARYRITNHDRFAAHLSYVRDRGLQGVIELAHATDEGFSKDPRVGPWVSVIRADQAFARDYARQDPEAYALMVTGMVRLLFDRDTVPGVEPEDLLRLDCPTLVVPGEDASHAPSAARYLEECIPGAEYWDVPVEEQTSSSAPERLLQFLDAVAE
jgi:pimeloyl-ACP methyl ester carboxylesterase